MIKENIALVVVLSTIFWVIVVGISLSNLFIGEIIIWGYITSIISSMVYGGIITIFLQSN